VEATAPQSQCPTEQPVTLDAAEKQLIENALEETSGNVSEAARRLGITRMVMRYRMKKYGLSSSKPCA
jgi:DNA-binding NtrC family response regulator